MKRRTGGALFPTIGKMHVWGTAIALCLLVGRVEAATEAGVCANCHFAETGSLLETGGHAETLDCQSCHGDRRPERVGPGHRDIPRCTACHDGAGHPAAAKTGSRRRELRNCMRCHDVHGSPNLALVPTTLRAAGRLVPVRFDNTAGAAPGGFTDPTAPGTGLCEACHRTTAYYRRTGGEDDHFTDTCTDCHAHAAKFGVVTSDANCALCHQDQAERFAKPSQHGALLACSDCHADTGTPPGPDHRASAPCADCHETATHAPDGAAQPCTQCHEPHGTDNASLVLDALRTTLGNVAPIRFDNLDGRADGSFASATDPGAGICEVCHTTTAHYRNDGSGADHFTVSCLPCHRHSGGFAPQ
jgi:predicted CXXCH cytochrome family protein